MGNEITATLLDVNLGTALKQIAIPACLLAGCAGTDCGGVRGQSTSTRRGGAPSA